MLNQIIRGVFKRNNPCKSLNNNINIKCYRMMSSPSLWGERTIKWLEDETTKHMNDHESDYDFNIPFLDNNAVNRQAIITPCVEQATSSWLIDEMLRRKYKVTGIAVPSANMDFLKNRFDMKKTDETKAKITYNNTEIDILKLESKEPHLIVEQRPVETFDVNNINMYEHYDVVFDEQPLLSYFDVDKSAYKMNDLCNTTIFGHSLKIGGILYLNVEGAKNYKERAKLMAKIESFYPSTHFVLINSRRTPWTRQFLFLKADTTIQPLS